MGSEMCIRDRIIFLDDVHVTFRTRTGSILHPNLVHAVQGVTIKLMPGQTIGIVGESGCGKSITTLAIMGLTEAGMQPFELDGDMVVCNGELYGFRPLKRQLTEKGYEFKSGSDCEIILPLYREYGLSMFAKLDAEFAMIIYDAKRGGLVAARDLSLIHISEPTRP